MRSFRFALVTMPLLLAAQQPASIETPASPESKKTEDKCIVEGQVVNALTGDAIKKARIHIYGTDERSNASYTTLTDSDGRFVLEDIPPSRYQLYAARNGYVGAMYGARNPGAAGTTLSLDQGQRVRDIVFHLVPHAVIAGHVLDEDGEPVDHAQLSVVRYRYMRGKEQNPVAGMTDDLGEYRIFGLAPGRYYLNVTYHVPGLRWPGRAPTGRAEEDYAPTYYPSTNDPAGAVAIELAAGAQLRAVDVVLLKTRTVRVRGRVISTVGDQLPRNISVMLMPKDRTYADFFRTGTQVRDPQGNFELRGVAPGSYVLRALSWEQDKSYSARQSVEVGDNGLENLVLTLTPGAELKGQVHIDGTLGLSIADLRVNLEPQGPTPMGTASVSVKEDGGFAFPSLAADSYALTVNPLPENCYIKAVRLEGGSSGGSRCDRGGIGPDSGRGRDTRNCSEPRRRAGRGRRGGSQSAAGKWSDGGPRARFAPS
jgi:protocatechuate 3,4-dioxygenase beta subunit